MENKETALSIIENMNLQSVENSMNKIGQFQNVMQNTLKSGHDFGVIPGTSKPTLLKPGAEKIAMMMGLRTEFEIVDNTRDWNQGFFQYQVRCKLYKGDMLITEGLGACNTKEKKYINQDAFTLDNTVLKMAKKRSFIDAILLVASLSEVFTQDIEDMQEFIQQEQVENLDIESAKNMKINFGKYKGSTLGEIMQQKPDYVDWLSKNARDTVVKQASKLLIEEGLNNPNEPSEETKAEEVPFPLDPEELDYERSF